MAILKLQNVSKYALLQTTKRNIICCWPSAHDFNIWSEYKSWIYPKEKEWIRAIKRVLSPKFNEKTLYYDYLKPILYLVEYLIEELLEEEWSHNDYRTN